LSSSSSQQGGIGFIGTAHQNDKLAIRYTSIGLIAHQLQVAKERLGREDEDKVGVGFTIKNQLDRDPVIIDQILSLDPKNIWLTASDSVNIEPYVSLFLREDNYRHKSVRLFTQVSSSKMALQAAKLGSHVVILRGAEAGGPPKENHIPLQDLIKETLTLFKTVDPAERPILLGAGGISSGYDLKNILDKGLDGVALGTVLALSEESCLTTEEKVELMMGSASSLKTRIEKVNLDGTKVEFSFLNKHLETIKTTKQIVNEIMNDCVSMQVLTGI
jgi:nitronate monooxygenase